MSFLLDVEQRHFDFAKINEIMKTSITDQTDEKFNENMNILRKMGETELLDAFMTERSIKIKTKKIDEREKEIHTAKEQVEIKKLEIKYIDELIHIFKFNKEDTHLSRCITEKKALEVEAKRLQLFHENLVNKTGLIM